MKTKRSAAKRYRLTGTGKLVRRKAYKNHILTKKSEKRKRTLSLKVDVDVSDRDRAMLQLPYPQYIR
ncbi:MAG: 50S ribosomal protein L35 [Candidatus Sericytochromatia bacterium]